MPPALRRPMLLAFPWGERESLGGHSQMTKYVVQVVEDGELAVEWLMFEGETPSVVCVAVRRSALRQPGIQRNLAKALLALRSFARLAA